MLNVQIAGHSLPDGDDGGVRVWSAVDRGEVRHEQDVRRRLRLRDKHPIPGKDTMRLAIDLQKNS